ncbi:MAG: leucine-rich repeat protein [Clostridiales bacterium]|nr:leucine-rich repeat protein [Clostridiales bacterium]
MKKSGRLVGLIVCVFALLGVAAVGCGNKDDKKPKPTAQSEWGVYYYDYSGSEYLLSLADGNKATVIMGNTVANGTYTRKNNDISFKYGGDVGNMSAQINADNSVITVTYNSVPMQFLRRVIYSVSFDSAEGSEVAKVEVLNGKSLAKPIDPVRDGYTFLGWFKDDEYKTPFIFESDIISADTTLYAQWGKSVLGENVYTVSFDVGDYEGAVNPEPKTTVGGKLYGLQQPTREGYTFLGWWYSATGKADELTNRVDADTVYRENTTLYAVWQGAREGSKLSSPAVSVVGNRISWDSVAQASQYRVQVSCVPADANQNFAEIDRAVTETSTEVAFTVVGKYTVTVTAVSAAGASNNSNPTTRTYLYNPLARVSLFSVVGDTLLWNAVDNAEKYIVSVDCGNELHDHSAFDNGKSTYFNFANCEMQRGGIKFTVTAVADGYTSSTSETFTYAKDLAAVPAPAYDEATQTVSWQAVPNATNYDVTVLCGTTGHEHTRLDLGRATSYCVKECAVPDGGLTVSITPRTKGYNSPDPTTILITAAQKSAPATPSDIRIVETTLRWNSTGADKYVVRIGDKEIEATTNSLDLAGQSVNWTKGSDYKIYVKAVKGGQSSLWSDAVDARYYAMHSSLSYAKNTVSWRPVIGATAYEVRVNESDVVRVTDGSASARVRLTEAGDNKIEVRFFAGDETSAWAPLSVKAYALTFDTRGGVAAASVRLTQYYAVGDEITLPTAQQITKDGYTLGDFYTTPSGPDGNGARFADKTFTAAGDMVLYASWVPKTYKITLNYNGGGTGVAEATVTYGKPFKLPTPDTIVDGTTVFGGWCANSIGTAATYTDERGNGLGVWSIAGDTELYASWLSVFTFEKTKGGSAGFYYMVKSNPKAKRDVPVATIPATYKMAGDTIAYPITQLAKDAFDSCQGIQEINLPSTMETILPRMFETMSSVREINVYAAEGGADVYYSDNGVLYYNNATAGTVDLWALPRAKTGVYTLHSRVNTIPTRAMYYSRLDEVRIPASVSYVAKDAFYYTYTTTITFLSPAAGEASYALRLESGAFNNASKTTKVTLPAREIVVWNSTTNAAIANPDFNIDVFVNCSALTTVEVDSGNAYFQSIDGLLCSKGADATILYCPKDRVGVFTVPAGIVKIGRRAFSNCRKITQIIIPNWVNEIEEEAFTGYKVRLADATTDTTVYGCTELATVTFKSGDGVAADLVIGKNAFGNKTETASYFCSKLSTIEFQKDSGVAEIGEYAFARCPITKVTLPASLSNVKEGAFYGCDKLGTVEYAPNGKDIAIGDQAFANCTSFTTIKLPANVTQFSGGVFAGCNNLTTVEVDPNNPVLTGVDGVLFSKDKTEILFYPFGKEGNYQIPATVTKISGGAFSGKSNVTEITISKNVIEIGDGAFRQCTNLEKVIFEPNGTAELKIGDGAFAVCGKLTEFRLPERVKSIPNRMLLQAAKLDSIYIPSGAERIGEMAFAGVGESVGDQMTDEVVIPASVKEIGAMAFYKSNITKVRFEDKASGDLIFEVFENDKNSANTASPWLDAYFPVNVKKGESKLFLSCIRLQSVVLPKGLKAMPAGMFDSCISLTTVDIPGTVTEMEYVFTNCSALKTVTFAKRDNGEDGKPLPLVMKDGYETSTGSGSSTGGPTYSYYGVFAGCKSLTDVELPEGLTRIPDYCFFNCTALEKIHVPASVRNGEYNVGTTQLTAIGKKAFSSGVIGQASTTNTRPTMKLHTVTFADGGTGDFSLGDGSFQYCSGITTMTLPSRLADAHVNASGKDWVVSGVRVGYQSNTSSYTSAYPSFDGTKLATLNVATGGAHYSSDDGILYNADKTALVYVPIARTKDINVPASVELVKNFAFYKNVGVQKVTFLERTSADVATQADGDEPTTSAAPKGLVIGENAMATSAGAFAGSKVQEVYFPKHLSQITSYAFHGCTALTKIEFAQGTTGLTSIDSDAFNTDAALLSVILPDSVTTIGDRAFRGNSKLATFSVSANSKLTAIGVEAFYGTALTEFYVPAAQSFNLGVGAFSNCPKLATVHLPNTVTNFDGLFTGSYALSNLDIYAVQDEQGNDLQGTLTSDNGVIYLDGGKTLSYYPIGKTDKSYTIPVGVTKIAAGAFMNNGYLEEIKIPNTVELILDKAFYMMPSLKKVEFERDTTLHYVKLTDAEKETYTGDRYIKIVNGGEEEYAKAPDGAEDVYKLLPVPDSLKIGVTVNATTGEVKNSDGSTSTGVFAFCQSLEVVNLPTRTEHISGFSFYFCKNLHTVTFDENCRLGVITKCLFSNTALQYGGTREQIEENDKNPFVLPPSMKEFAAGSTTADENRNPFGKVTKLVIPSSVTKVGNYTFHNSEYLQEVEFTGDKNTVLVTQGTNMFKLCSQLRSVIFTNKITTITSNMFQDCSSLTTVAFEKPATGQTLEAGIRIPSTVTKIDGSAFSGCSSLTAVVLPASGLANIAGSAFLKCYNLATITYNEENTDYDLYLPTSITTIGSAAFAGTKVTKAYIPSSVTSFSAPFSYNAKYIDGTAVYCDKLQKVVFASDNNNTKFTSLPSDTFMKLEALEEVVLPTNQKFVTINTAAFAFSGLKHITIPANVTKISRGAFAYCARLEKVSFAEGSTVLTVENGTYNAYSIYNNTYLNSYNYLGAFAHSGTDNGRAEAKAKAEAADATDEVKAAYAANYIIDMSKRKITKADKWIFFDTMNLDVKLSEETTEIATQAFQNAYIDKIVIPAKTTQIRIAAFTNSKIKEIEFAAADTEVTIAAGTKTDNDTDSNRAYNGAFAYCSELTKVDMSGRKITTIPNYTFYKCPNIDEIKWSVDTAATETEPMTTHTTTIGNWAFEYSFAIDELDLPRGITSIGQWAFGYGSIANLKLPNTLSDLQYAAFYQAGLQTVEFEDNSVITTFGLDSRSLGWTFGYNTELTTVKLPESLKVIPADAFNKTGLISITIPKSVTTIGNYAFGATPSLKTITFEKDNDGNCALTTLNEGAFNGTGISSIIIPKGVTAISAYMFGGCNALETIEFEKDDDGNCALTYIGNNSFRSTVITSIVIPKSVTEIGNYAFDNNPALASVTIEKDENGDCALTTIGAGAFNVSSITEFVIPKSVTSLNANPFRYCSKLTSLTVEDGSEAFVVENNVVYSADKSILFVYAAGIEGAFAIPSDVVEIGDYAFAGSKFAGAVNVSLGGFTVGDYAFEGCGVTSVTLGGGVIIGNSAFADNVQLASVTVGDNATIGESAFAGCVGLNSVAMGEGAVIGIKAFADDAALTAVNLPTGATVMLDSFVGSGVKLDNVLKADTQLKYGELDAYIDGTVVFGDVNSAVAALKANANLENVVLAEGITSIANNAFKDVTNLKKITLPSTLTTIGSYAFQNCTGLTEVVFAKDAQGNTALDDIGIYAFNNTGIVSIVIPKSVTKFRYYAFYNCAKLTKVEFEAGSGVTGFQATTASNIGSSVDSRNFANCPMLETVILPENITFIPMTMFENSGITHITIPATVTKIYKNAFLNCKQLETVTFAKNANGGTALTEINESAFNSSGITSIAIPATVTTFGTKAFQNCASLESVTFEKDADGNCAFKTFGTYSFEGTAIKSISIPRLVTSVNANAFNGVSTLTSVTFERDEDGNCALTSIAKSAFAGTGITAISIPRTVTEIGGESSDGKDPAGAFYNCASLANVTFETDENGVGSLKYIYSYAFAGTAIAQITLPSTAGTASYTIYYNAFADCSNLELVRWGENSDGNSATATIYPKAFANTPKLKNFIIGNRVKPYNDAFVGWGSDITIYVVGLPGPNTAWALNRWLHKCDAKWVWYWSEDKGFLNADGKFENEVNNA